MNKKKIWYIIPTALLPYLLLFALAVLLFSTKHTVFTFIMDYIFNSNAWNIVAVLLLYCLFAAALSIGCFVVSIRKGWEALSLAKYAMLVKLFQIPAYALIFVIGLLLAITLFTIPISVGLFLFNCICLLLTGLLTTAAVINAVRQGIFKSQEVVWMIVLQLVFCADVAASIILYIKLRKIHKSAIANS